MVPTRLFHPLTMHSYSFACFGVSTLETAIGMFKFHVHPLLYGSAGGDWIVGDSALNQQDPC